MSRILFCPHIGTGKKLRGLGTVPEQMGTRANKKEGNRGKGKKSFSISAKCTKGKHRECYNLECPCSCHRRLHD